MDILSNLGNIPVNSSTIASLYPEIKGKNQKISKLEKSNEIIRLKRGMYDRDSLKIWSNNYFLQLADMIKFK
jgi:hypothetical protein